MCLWRAVFPGRSIKTRSSWVSTPVLLFCLKFCWRLKSQTGEGPAQLLSNFGRKEKEVALGNTGEGHPQGAKKKEVATPLFNEGRRRECGQTHDPLGFV